MSAVVGGKRFGDARVQPLATVRALWPFVRPEQRRLREAAVATFALTAVEVSIPLLSRVYLDWITGDLQGLGVPLPALDPGVIIALLVVCALARGLFLTRQRSLAGQIGERVAARLRTRLWSQLQELPLEHTQRRGPGRLLVRFISDIRAVQRVVSDGLVQGTADLVLVVAVLLTLALLNWLLALPVVLLLPVYAGLFWSLNPKLRRLSRATRRRLTRLSAYLHERIAGMKLVKASVRQASEATRVERLTRDLADRGARRASTAATLQGVAAAAVSCSFALALGLAGGEFVAGRLTSGTLVAFVMLLWLLSPALRRLTNFNRSLQLARVSVDRLSATLAAQPEAPPDRKARRLRVQAGELALKDVSFAFGDGTPALQDVSLWARRGEVVAVVGPNGAGKSTLFDLILRFHEPTSGRIVIDGRNIANVSLASLRRQIGWDPQEVLLFDGTIAENIAYGGHGKRSHSEIERAARLAGVDEVAASLPDGLRTRIGEGGRALSHGQRRRVALARALMADPPILLLDEVFSGLDPEAEQALARMLRELARDKTLIVAAHRLPALLAPSRIYALDRGRIVEPDGDPAEVGGRPDERSAFMLGLPAKDDGRP